MAKGIGNVFKGDKVIWMVFFFLCVISIIEVFSASSFLTYGGKSYWSPMIKHSGVLLLGLLVMLVVLNIKCKYFKVLTPFAIGLSLALLIWALIGGVVENDAHRWVSLFGIKFQPSEIAKGTMVLVTAQILSSTQTENGADHRAFWWILIVCAPMILLIAPENLSTALLICITIFMMMIIGRIPRRQTLMLVMVVMALVVMAVMFVLVAAGIADKKLGGETEEIALVEETEPIEKPKESVADKVFHRASEWRNRMLAFVDFKRKPVDEVDIDGKGAQRAYSYIAIASSHVTGVGPGNSEERDFLSQAFSDFIYAIIVEELGLFGAFCVAFFYIVLMYRTGRIASRCENNFPAFLAMGLALMLTVQALFNMCVAVGLAPITGQPLPLVSKGGTSTVINCMYIGVILSISRSAKRRVLLPDGTEQPSDTTPDPNPAIPEE